MKIQRFTLLFGLMFILLTACTPAQTPPANPDQPPTAEDGTGVRPGGGAPIKDFTPDPTNDDAPIPFPPNTPVLIWHREGGIAGFCDDVTVLASGAYTVANCKGQATTSGQLSASQLLQLTRLVNKVQSFEHENTDPAVADAMSVKITFKGAGSVEAIPEDLATINNLISLLLVPANAAGNIDAYPQAVSKARDFLAGMLDTPASEITVTSVDAVEWADRCLGVVVMGMMCAQGITPGYRVILSAKGESYELHTDESGDSIQQVKDPSRVKP